MSVQLPSTAIPQECIVAVLGSLDDHQYQKLLHTHRGKFADLAASHVRDMQSALSVSHVRFSLNMFNTSLRDFIKPSLHSSAYKKKICKRFRASRFLFKGC